MEKNLDLIEILSYVSPGSKIRHGLDNIVDAGKGALIVIGDSEDILKIVDGGFYINCDYTPQRIYELAKMDGAIVLSDNARKIIYANVQLQPDNSICTDESGTRHKTAERVAKETDKLVIAISERRRRITLYKGNIKYTLKNINDTMSEASQALKTLERYKNVLEKTLNNLTIMEFDDIVTLYEVTLSIQKFEMLFKIAEEVKNYIAELGLEGRLIRMQLDEILLGTDEELRDLINDYFNLKEENLTLENIILNLKQLSSEELLELENIAYILGYGRNLTILEKKIIPKGYRALSKIFRLTRKDIEKIVENFGDFNNILENDMETAAEIKGITKFKARSIKNGLKRLKTTILLEK